MDSSKVIRGGVLRPSAAIQAEYIKGVHVLIRRMADDVRREVKSLFEISTLDMAMDENISSQARIRINGLLEKYDPLFNLWAKKATKRMVDRTLKNSDVTLKLSLKEMSSTMTLPPGMFTGRLDEIITASTNEAVGLIKLIPQKYLGDVQGQVMRSITSGNGLQDLLPYLTEKYDQNIKHARNVALDQTRKAYSAINAGRMKAIGQKTFEWIHTGGSMHPRKEHIAMHGKIFNLDDLPVIDSRTGEKGLPGQAIFCRCTMRPIISFDDEAGDD